MTTVREAGADSSTLVSSPNHVPFYERHWWERFRDESVENTDGVEMTCVKLRKPLSSS